MRGSTKAAEETEGMWVRVRSSPHRACAFRTSRLELADMPIIDKKDATDVVRQIEQVFEADDGSSRLQALRRLFVEKLDFTPLGDTVVRLYPSSRFIRLPKEARLCASASGVIAVYVDLSETDIDSRRVRLSDARDAIEQIAKALEGDVLVVFSNRANDQLHFVWPRMPSSGSGRPLLRRIVIERGVPMRTVAQQLSNLYWSWKESNDIQGALDDAFDVEAVTTKFFSEYRRVFDHAKSLVKPSTAGFTADQHHVFVQTLFNRLMFVYFVSRKGWLKFGDGTDYLNDIWNDHRASGELSTFFRTRLRPLFFSGLNNPSAKSLAEDDPQLYTAIGDVPFLNGGLFEQDPVLDMEEAFDVPDEAVKPVLSDLFDRFNFTVSESTPFDVEVAVDPEMLGKVFEETVNARNESGAFYTPRPVVSFMCREALKGYLVEAAPSVDPTQLARFVDEHTTKGLGVQNASQLASALSQVTVVDPACGSGAYLLGMLQELVALHNELYNVEVGLAKDVYALKLDIIQRNIYGADVDQFAVNVAMLRLWLSLAVEYDGVQPEPLPNLEYQILQGDALLAPDPSPANYGDLFRNQAHQVADELAACKRAFVTAFDRDKQTLAARISDLEADLTLALNNGGGHNGYVDWRIKFTEVFDRYGGFHIAIANPPYVRQEDIDLNNDKTALRELYWDAVTGQSDLYCYFYARGLQLLAPGGMHVFVSSNSWLDVKYGETLQSYILKHATVDTVYDCAVERQFTTASINTIISMIRKGVGRDPGVAKFITFTGPFNDAVIDPALHTVRTPSIKELANTDKWGAIFLKAPDIYHHLLSTFSDKFIPVGDVATLKRGRTTGANDFFLLDDKSRRLWGIEDEFLEPVVRRARDYRTLLINRQEISDYLFVCSQSVNDLQGTAALEYIRWGVSAGFSTRPTCRVRTKWYDLTPIKSAGLAMMYQALATYRTFRLVPEMLCVDIVYTLDCERELLDRLWASMNSVVGQLMFTLNSRTPLGGGMLEIKKYEVERTLMVNPSLLPDIDLEMYGRTVWDVLNPPPEEKVLDSVVFDVLSLSSGEREAVYEAIVSLGENRKTKSGTISYSSGAV